MLRRVNHPDGFMDPGDALVRIADASFPVPFEHRLEFNAPVHGTWNIVHIGMLVPECHQIYVCSDNCMRGVVLTAAEMDAADRFSSVGQLYERCRPDCSRDGCGGPLFQCSHRRK